MLAACISGQTESQPASTAEVTAPAPPIEGLPRQLCYFLDNETLTSGVRLTLGPQSAVTGDTYGNIHAEESGYYAFFLQTHEGSISGNTITVTTETSIEGDDQILQETWTVLPDRLVRPLDIYFSADCADVDARLDEIYGY